jgi:hypothetical protein
MSYPVCASSPTVPKAISFHPRKCPQGSSGVGINMVHKTHKGLLEPGDYRPGSWRDGVGLLMALIGFALLVGMTLYVSAVDTVKDVGRRWHI